MAKKAQSKKKVALSKKTKWKKRVEFWVNKCSKELGFNKKQTEHLRAMAFENPEAFPK